MINDQREPKIRDVDPDLTIDVVRDAASKVLSECLEIAAAYAFG